MGTSATATTCETGPRTTAAPVTPCDDRDGMAGTSATTVYLPMEEDVTVTHTLRTSKIITHTTETTTAGDGGITHTADTMTASDGDPMGVVAAALVARVLHEAVQDIEHGHDAQSETPGAVSTADGTADNSPTRGPATTEEILEAFAFRLAIALRGFHCVCALETTGQRVRIVVF